MSIAYADQEARKLQQEECRRNGGTVEKGGQAAQAASKAALLKRTWCPEEFKMS